MQTLQNVGLIRRNFLALELVRGVGLLDLVAHIFQNQVHVLHRLLLVVHLLLVLLAELDNISLQQHHLLGKVQVAIAAIGACRPHPFDLRLQALHISDASLHLQRLGLHDVPHLLKQLLRFDFESSYVLLGLS